MMEILELLKEDGNDTCADCGAAIGIDNAWAILSYGIFVCENCKLVHIGREDDGILPTQFWQRWDDKNFTQIREKGNKKSNEQLLSAYPVWSYRLSANDHIKLKEYWINCKYNTNTSGAAQTLSIAALTSFIRVQFTSTSSKGSIPCCVVLQDDKLLITSAYSVDRKEIAVECIETLLINSTRISQKNGIQLTYRVNDANDDEDGTGVAFMCLHHNKIETLLGWINLVLYAKYNILKKKYPTMTDEKIVNILNCAVIKEGCVFVAGYGLVYISLTEARLDYFQHLLDEKPSFDVVVSKMLNASASEYLDAFASFLNVDSGDISNYDDWFSALEDVLKVDKINAIPDYMPKPKFPFSLLKKTEEVTVKSALPESSGSISQVANSAMVMSTVYQTKYLTAQPSISSDIEKEKSNSDGCYPPIGPMGEVGKVVRGELPPDAIKSPPTRNHFFGIASASTGIGVLPNFASTATQSINYGSYRGASKPTLNSYTTNFTRTPTSLVNQAMLTGKPFIPTTKMALQQLPNVDRNSFIAQQIAQPRKKQEPMFSNNGYLHSKTAMGQQYNLQTLAVQQHNLKGNHLPNKIAPIVPLGRSPNTKTDTLLDSRISHHRPWDNAATTNRSPSWKRTGVSHDLYKGSNLSPRTPYHEADKEGCLRTRMEKCKVSNQAGGTGTSDSWRNLLPDVAPSQANINRSLTNWSTNGLSARADQCRSSLQSGGRGLGTGLSSNLSHDRISFTEGRSFLPNEMPCGRGGEYQQNIIQNIMMQWRIAEQQINYFIHQGSIQPATRTLIGLDKNNVKHATDCVAYLYEILCKQNYKQALSILRGLREVFSKSDNTEIRNLFMGYGELDTLKLIFISGSKEKCLPDAASVSAAWQSPNATSTQAGPALQWAGSSTTERTQSNRSLSHSFEARENLSASGISSAKPSFNRAPTRPTFRASTSCSDIAIDRFAESPSQTASSLNDFNSEANSNTLLDGFNLAGRERSLYSGQRTTNVQSYFQQSFPSSG